MRGDAVAAFEELGATTSDVVRTRMFITNADEHGRDWPRPREVFGVATPAATMVVVAALLDPAWKVELEAEAVVEA